MGYALYAGGSWKKWHSRGRRKRITRKSRINAKGIDCREGRRQIHFPMHKWCDKLAGKDSEVRTSDHKSARTRKYGRTQQWSSRRCDGSEEWFQEYFWKFFLFYRHHVQERQIWFVLQESSLPDPLKCTDAVWTCCRHTVIDDFWYVDGDWKLSGPCIGLTQLTILIRAQPSSQYWMYVVQREINENTRNVQTSIHMARSMVTHVKEFSAERKKHWAKETSKFLRKIWKLEEIWKKKKKNARRKLESQMKVLCHTNRKRAQEIHPSRSQMYSHKSNDAMSIDGKQFHATTEFIRQLWA